MIEKNGESESQIDLTGQALGGFTILRRLGRGGMADVYLARQDSLDRNVALKVLKPDLAQDQSYIERFTREAQAAAKLVQANIVGVYEVGEIEGFHFIAQEYVVGRNLREYLARHGAVKPVMAKNILRQVTLALQKAEALGVTHRDIKPENIMLSPSGEVKVADFGLARVNDSTDKHLTQIGITMGTPLYMSPEQVEGNDVDVRSDIYSLGITAYHMLAGQPPFDGENALAIAVQHINSIAADLNVIRPDIPIELVQLIEKMIAKSPENRPQSAGQLLKAIQNILVDGDEDWEQLVETLAIESADTTADSLPQSRLAATRQLQSVMKGSVRSWWTELSTILGFLILLTTGVFVGLWFSNRYPIENPFSKLTEPSIAEQRTAKDQYEFARDFHPRDIGYYQAVIDLHSLENTADTNQTRLFHLMAQERIAELLLIASDYAEANKIYASFVDINFNQRFDTVGRAGLVICSLGLKKHDLAKENLASISTADESYLNLFMSQRLQKARDYYTGEFTPVSSDDRSAIQ